MTVFSHSRLSCFERCPLKFKLRYIDKLKTDRQQGIEAFLGEMVHSALEKLYKDLRFSKLNTLDQLLEWYSDLWERSWRRGILIVRKGYTKGNYKAMGERYIRDYYQRYHPFDQDRTIALEERVKVSLDPEGRYRLQGYIDRLSYLGKGVYQVHDYKTNFNIPVKQYLEDDRQLALYALAVLNNYQDAKRVRLVWHFLSVDKEVVLEKAPGDLEKLRRDTMELIDRIRSCREFPPSPGPLCDWCEFLLECPERKHPERVSTMPRNRFLKEPGVKLVNRYAELKRKQAEFNERVEGELSEIQEALFRYAEREGVRVVAGSDVQATVWSKDCVKFPGKDDPGREELEDIIRKAGHWNDLSMLNTWELEKLVSSGQLPQDTIKRLAKFARKERIRRIYLRKPKHPR